MAKFTLELPTEIQDDVMYIYDNLDKICGQMTQAGAKTVQNIVRSTAPSGIRNSEMMKCLRITRVYRTSDGDINTKVGFYGYFKNRDGVRTAAPLVANVFEYGRDGAPFPKEPFFRAAFKADAITKAMLEAQVKASKGLLR